MISNSCILCRIAMKKLFILLGIFISAGIINAQELAEPFSLKEKLIAFVGDRLAKDDKFINFKSISSLPQELQEKVRDFIFYKHFYVFASSYPISLRDTEDIKYVLCSSDGKRLITANDKVLLWDISDINHPTSVELGQSKGMKAIAFSPDSKFAVIIVDDKNIWLWDISDIHALTSSYLGKTESHIYSVVFSPNSAYIAIRLLNNSTYLWELAKGHDEKPFFLGEYWAVKFSPNSKYIAVLTAPNLTAGIWDIASSAFYDIDTSPFVRSFDFNHDGTLLLTGSDKGAKLWDISNLENSTSICLDTTIQGAKAVFSVAVSSCGNYALAGFAKDMVCLWNISDPSAILPTCLLKEKEHATGRDHIDFVAFSPDAHYALAQKLEYSQYYNPCGLSTIYLWNLSQDKGLKYYLFKDIVEESKNPFFDPQGRFMLARTKKNEKITLQLWRLKPDFSLEEALLALKLAKDDAE